MREDIVYGFKGEQPGFGQFVKLFMFEDDRHLGINWTDNGHIDVFHFLIKDIREYDDFKDELIAVLRCCDDINEAYYELEAYLDSGVVDEFLEEYPDYEPEKRTDEEIDEYMAEAFDRVWLARKQNMLFNMMVGTELVDADVLEKCNKAIDEVCAEYNINFAEVISDYEYGYWSGILSALRWVMGDEKDFLDT